MTDRDIAPLPLSENILLDVFDLPVTFHRCLVPVTGSVTAALMLSQAIWASQAADAQEDGWFAKSREEWEEETGLSRWEQQTARRVLRDSGFLEERRMGIPARLCFRVRSEEVLRALQVHANGLRR